MRQTQEPYNTSPQKAGYASISASSTSTSTSHANHLGLPPPPTKMNRSSDVEGNILSYFSPLDELIQIVYQGSDKFVIVSGVDDIHWKVRVGLVGLEGRWWMGAWGDLNIRKFVGTQCSSIVVESFAQRLAQIFTQGELQIGNWGATEEGAELNLTLGPNAKKPIRMPLTEMSSQEAASYATNVFVEIALQAQSHKSRLYPPPSGTSSIHSTPSGAHYKRKAEGDPFYSSTPKRLHQDDPAQEKIKALEAELAEQKKIAANALNAAKSSTSGLNSKTKAPLSAARPVKGASLANPNRKARKVEAIEFESDG